MQERYIAAADLGSGKIAVCVAKVCGDDTQVIYYGVSPSDGISHSCVFNPKKASEALKKALAEAEEELHIKILQVVVGLPRWGVSQQTSSAGADRTNPEECISDEEISILKDDAIDSYPLEDPKREEIYGAVAQSFTADELFQQSRQDIIGATASHIEGNFKIFTGARKASNNIDMMLNMIGVAPAEKVFVPHAVAKAVLSEDERENGVALVELGAGVTSVTIYQDKILRHYSAVPFGGASITTDIKYECGFRQSLAENIKLAYGACMPEKLQSMEDKILQINDEENGTYEHLPVKYLSEIITCRVREILDAILFQIQESGFADKLRGGIVLTGGGAGLVNLATLLKDMSGYNVRLGFPQKRLFSADGCPEVLSTGAVACVGMVLDAGRNAGLNCTTEPVVEEPEEDPETSEGETAPAPEQTYVGTVFEADSDDEIIRPVKRPKRPKNPRKPPFGITWGEKIKTSGIFGSVDKFLDDTIGGLFDAMEEGGQVQNSDN